MSPTKQEQSASTIATLVGVARELFAERGYAEVALEDLAARASVTRGAVYHHFDGKRGVFEAVLDAVHAEVASAVDAAAESAGSPWEQLMVGCHAFIDAASEPRARRILLVDGPAVLGWQRWRELDAAHSGRLLDDVLDELSDGGLVEPSLAAAASAMLSGAMNEAALWLARDEVTSSDHRSAHAILDRLLESIRA